MSGLTNRKYFCPMHEDVTSDKPGKCPECGMDLVRESELDGGKAHDHSSMMASPEAASDFLRRFFIVTALLVPLALFSAPAVKYLGISDFPYRDYLEFGIATAVFYFGLVFFKHAEMEIKMRQYGMMTLVSLGVGAGYLFSAASTFIPAINVEFYLEIATLIWVLLFGHFLEAKSSSAAGDALKEVAKLLLKKESKTLN
jgi:Cu2+-exporting ATPase